MSVNPEELTLDLEQFIGSQEFYRFNTLYPQFIVTEGVKYLADNAKCYWLLDLIASYQRGLLKKGHTFQVWKLNVKDRRGNVYCEDGNYKRLRHQEIPYTDFPLPTIKLFAIWNTQYLTIMLPREY